MFAKLFSKLSYRVLETQVPS